jgi:hypothetical protein
MKVTAEVKVEPKESVPVGAVAAKTAGATGVRVGVAGADEAEAEEVPPVAPEILMAVAVNVYATSLVNPVTIHEPLGPVTVQVSVTPFTCGDAVTV